MIHFAGMRPRSSAAAMRYRNGVYIFARNSVHSAGGMLLITMLIWSHRLSTRHGTQQVGRLHWYLGAEYGRSMVGKKNLGAAAG